METLFYVNRRDDIHGRVTIPFNRERDDYPTLAHAMREALEVGGWVQCVSSLEDGNGASLHLYPTENGWAT